MKAYFDTSVIVTIIASDEGWGKIAAWLTAHDPQSFYSDFGEGEVYAAIGNRVRRRDVSETYANELIGQSRAYLATWDQLEITPADIAAATTMVSKFFLGLRLHDAIHVATTRRLGGTLISTDVQQVRAARKLGIATVNPLEPDENVL